MTFEDSVAAIGAHHRSEILAIEFLCKKEMAVMDKEHATEMSALREELKCMSMKLTMSEGIIRHIEYQLHAIRMEVISHARDYGIEIEARAAEISKLQLIIAQYQAMFNDNFESPPSSPVIQFYSSRTLGKTSTNPLTPTSTKKVAKEAQVSPKLNDRQFKSQLVVKKTWPVFGNESFGKEIALDHQRGAVNRPIPTFSNIYHNDTDNVGSKNRQNSRHRVRKNRPPTLIEPLSELRKKNMEETMDFFSGPPHMDSSKQHFTPTDFWHFSSSLELNESNQNQKKSEGVHKQRKL